MSVVPRYDENPWESEDVVGLLRLFPEDATTIRVHFAYHNGSFNAQIPFVLRNFQQSVTNTSTTSGVTLVKGGVTEAFLSGVQDLLDHYPAYSIQSFRILYMEFVVDIEIAEKKVVVYGKRFQPTVEQLSRYAQTVEYRFESS